MSAAPIIVEPSNSANASVIWLHGLGADGYDFVDIIPQLALPASHGIRFVFPHAPVQPVSLNGGLPMRAWFDILPADYTQRYDIRGVHQAEVLVQQYIAAQVASGISSRRIVLVGFSQGGALALFAGLRHAQPLAGIIALSAFLPHPQEIKTSRHAANQETAILMAHGTMDEMVQCHWGEQSYLLLKELGYKATWRTYPMAHQVCMPEIQAISQFLTDVLSVP